MLQIGLRSLEGKLRRAVAQQTQLDLAKSAIIDRTAAEFGHKNNSHANQLVGTFDSGSFNSVRSVAEELAKGKYLTVSHQQQVQQEIHEQQFAPNPAMLAWQLQLAGGPLPKERQLGNLWAEPHMAMEEMDLYSFL